KITLRRSTQNSQRSPRRILLVVFSAIFAISAFESSLRAQQPTIEAIPVRGHIFLIGGAGSNITVSAGPDGVFLVDTGTAQNADRVLAAIKDLQQRLQLAVPAGARGGAPNPTGPDPQPLSPTPAPPPPRTDP